jgi:Ca2+-binding RTX toxin-like protein
LTVNSSQTGQDSLTLSDQGSTTGQNYTVTVNTVSRSGAALITYDPVTSLTIKAGSGNDTLTVVSTAFNTPVTFNGGGGSNTVVGPNVSTTWSITANNGGKVGNVSFSSVQNLTGGSGNDTFKFSKGKSVSGTIDGGGGINTLDYSLYATGVTVNLPAGTATGAGTVANIQNVTGSPANDTITGVAGSVLNGNGGVDTLSGGSNDTFLIPTTQKAGTAVTGTGSGNTLVGPNIANTWIVTGAGSGTLNGGISFSGIANLTGGTGTDRFQFQAGGSIAGTVDGGGGGSNTLDYSSFGSAIAVNLQSSTSTGTGGFLHIGTLVGSGSPGDTLTGPNAVTTWTLNGTGAGTAGTFHFSAIANLTGGTGNDTFKFDAGGSVAGVIDGGGGSNTLDYSSFGSAITVNLQTQSATGSGGFTNIQKLKGSGAAADQLIGASTTNTWNITANNGGNVNGSFSFSAIANLTGGTGVDTFKISTGKSISGNLNGGGAPVNMGDWLDYSANSGFITVNLAAGTATGVGGNLSNIQDVLGGNNGNNLTGDAQGNILVGGNGNDTILGGSGRSLLIGGKGADQVTGGSGGDILIGGYTTYDQAHNEAALMSILAEWQSGDSYATRIADLKTGGGLNGTNVLVLGTTVKDDGAFNTLTGGAPVIPGDLDWFFQGIHDSILNKENGEQVN